MLLSSFYAFTFPFVIITFTSYYYFLKDDYEVWKKHRSYERMKSEELVELYALQRQNMIMMFSELFLGIVIWFALMSFTIDVLHIKMPLFLAYTFSPLYLISLQVYVIKKRLRKSTEIFKYAKRTAS
ncbi:MAG: hypothetical protein AB8F94_30030 [Saprospiraceae bacterium]